MCGFKANNTTVNKAQKQALRIVYNDFGESLKELLQSFTKYLRLTLIFMGHSALREKFNLCFSRVFC